MALFDKNAKRLKELEKLYQKNPSDNLLVRLERLRALPPDWYVDYYDKEGHRRAKKCNDQSIPGAEKQERKIRSDSETGVSAPVSKLRVSVAYMVDFRLQRKLNKAEKTGKWGGYRASKSLGNYIKKHIGRKTLDWLSENPMFLVELFENFPEKNWSPKSIWNYYKDLKAVLNKWMKKNLIVIANPMNAVDEPDPQVCVMDYVPTDDDFERIVATALVEGVEQEAINLLGAVRWSGLRINEVLQWQIEKDICLKPQDGGYPYFYAWISKQKRLTRICVPMFKQLYDILKVQMGSRTSGHVWRWKNPPYHTLDIKTEDGKVRKLMEVAGVPFQRPFHEFRKTFKMDLKRKGFTKDITKNMQGHATDSMDDWYTHYTRADLEKVVVESYRGDQMETKKEKGESFDSPLTT
jgi:hypothetical protein